MFSIVSLFFVLKCFCNIPSHNYTCVHLGGLSGSYLSTKMPKDKFKMKLHELLEIVTLNGKIGKGNQANDFCVIYCITLCKIIRDNAELF